MEVIKRSAVAKVATEPKAGLEARLPEDVLERAIVLREVLGPCRARQGYRPMGW